MADAELKKILLMHQMCGTFPFDLTMDRKLRTNFKLVSYSISLASFSIIYFIYLSVTWGLLDFENKLPKNIAGQLSIIVETVVFLSRFLNLVLRWNSIFSNAKNYHGVDDTLNEIGFKSDHISKGYPLKNLLISFYVLFTFLIVDFVADYIILDNNNEFSLPAWVYLCLVLGYNRFVLFLTICIITDTRIKFHTINSILLNIGSVYTCELHKPVNIFVNSLNCSPKTLIKTVKKARYYCVQFTTIHNSNLNFYILCYLAMNILSIIVHLYLLIILLRTSHDKLELLYPVAWCILKGISLVRLIASHCTTQKEADRTAMVVHRLLKYGDISDIANELRHLSLELLHNKFRFSVYGLFDIDYSLITSVTGVVCTYLIILYQIMGSKTNDFESISPVLNTTNNQPFA